MSLPTPDRGPVRALVFDVFGTVVDWRGSIIREGEAPPHWAGVVASALAPLREALDATWSERSARPPADDVLLAARLAPIVSEAARASLQQLYPDAERVWPSDLAEESRHESAQP